MLRSQKGVTRKSRKKSGELRIGKITGPGETKLAVEQNESNFSEK